MKPSLKSRYRWWIRLPGYPAPWHIAFWNKRWVASYHQGVTVPILARHMELITTAQVHGIEGDNSPNWIRGHALSCDLCTYTLIGSDFTVDISIPEWLADEDVWPLIVAMGRLQKEQDERKEQYDDDRY